MLLCEKKVAWFMQVIFPLILSLFFFSTACQVSAQDSRKSLLLFFKEGPCEVEQKMVEAEEFVKKIQDNVVFETLDCTHLSVEERRDIKQKFHLQDLPRLVLFDEKGDEITRYGFIGEQPETLAIHLLDVLNQVKDLESAASRLEELSLPTAALEDLYKHALCLKRERVATQFLNKGIEQNSLFFLLEKYRLFCEKGEDGRAIREKVISLDPRNEKEALFSLALIDFQTLSSQSVTRDAVRPLEDYLAQFGDRDVKNRWRLEMMVAQFYLNYDEWATSLQHAQAALNGAPIEVKKEIARCCHYIKEQLSREEHTR